MTEKVKLPGKPGEWEELEVLEPLEASDRAIYRRIPSPPPMPMLHVGFKVRDYRGQVEHIVRGFGEDKDIVLTWKVWNSSDLRSYFVHKEDIGEVFDVTGKSIWKRG